MSARRGRGGRRTATVLVAALASLLVLSLSAAAPAPARPRAASSATDCGPQPSAAQLAGARTLRHRVDSSRVTRRLQARWERVFARRLAAVNASQDPLVESLTEASTAARPTVRIGVHAHVVDGTHDKDERGPGRAAVRRQLRVVNNAYAQGQSDQSARAPFRFYLLTYDRTVNDYWHHGALGNRADRAMRRALHEGESDELDLYISEPRAAGSGGIVLGFSSFPWERARHPRLDGVTIHSASMPSGSARGYNRGDSATHEIGHWLGLYHTFENGCTGRGDRVADTPAEGFPSFGCDRGRDTCPDASGEDPIHNFLDYSFDACMDRLTLGQVQRMGQIWLAFRNR